MAAYHVCHLRVFLIKEQVERLSLHMNIEKYIDFLEFRKYNTVAVRDAVLI